MWRRLVIPIERVRVLKHFSTDASKSAAVPGSHSRQDAEPSTSEEPADLEKLRKNAEMQKKKSQDRIQQIRNRDTQLARSKEVATVEPGSEEDAVSRFEQNQAEVEKRAREMIALLRGIDFEEAVERRVERSPSDAARQKPVSRPRRIVYEEGELDNSDLSKPPSRTNPHPFDPFVHLLPTESRTMAPLVNHLPVLQKLVDAGVDLFEIDTTTSLSRHLVKLSEDDVEAKIRFLTETVGLHSSEVGQYLTRNPFLFIQSLDDLQARVNYLESKKFTKRQIAKICNEFRYWLNMDVETMDSRLGWMQRQLNFRGHELRTAITREPRVVMFGLGPLQRLVIMFNKELELDPAQIKQMFVTDPRVFICEPRHIRMNFAFLRYGLKLKTETIVNNPLALRCSLATMRVRHEFLRRRGRAKYEGQEETKESETAQAAPKEPSAEKVNQKAGSGEEVRIADFLDPSDARFAVVAARTYLVVYNDFLRTR